MEFARVAGLPERVEESADDRRELGGGSERDGTVGGFVERFLGGGEEVGPSVGDVGGDPAAVDLFHSDLGCGFALGRFDHHAVALFAGRFEGRRLFVGGTEECREVRGGRVVPLTQPIAEGEGLQVFERERLRIEAVLEESGGGEGDAAERLECFVTDGLEPGVGEDPVLAGDDQVTDLVEGSGDGVPGFGVEFERGLGDELVDLVAVADGQHVVEGDDVAGPHLRVEVPEGFDRGEPVGGRLVVGGWGGFGERIGGGGGGGIGLLAEFGDAVGAAGDELFVEVTCLESAFGAELVEFDRDAASVSEFEDDLIPEHSDQVGLDRAGFVQVRPRFGGERGRGEEGDEGGREGAGVRSGRHGGSFLVLGSWFFVLGSSFFVGRWGRRGGGKADGEEFETQRHRGHRGGAGGADVSWGGRKGCGAVGVGDGYIHYIDPVDLMRGEGLKRAFGTCLCRIRDYFGGGRTLE